jgi:hypothetical protein
MPCWFRRHDRERDGCRLAPIAMQASPQSGFDTPRSWHSQWAVSTMSGQVGMGVGRYACSFGARRTSSSVLCRMTVPASVRCGCEYSPSRGSLGRSGSPGWGRRCPPPPYIFWMPLPYLFED